MSYLSTHQLSFSHHPGIALFQDITFAINPGDRIGLAGVNGCGKTTLLRLLAGELEPASGRIIRRKGLRICMLHRPDPQRMSSGQQTREALAEAMREEADVYLLDEPTNHLDSSARDWLANWLVRRQVTCALVSHDRAFLNRVATRTLLLERGRATMHEGNYDFAMEEEEGVESRQWGAFDAQQRRIAAAERAAEKRDRLSEKVAKAPPGTKCSHDFYRRKAAKVARTGRLLRERQQLEATVSKPWEEQAISELDFGRIPQVPALVLHAAALTFGFPDGVPMGPVNLTVHRNERWSVSGPNGCGKTSLFLALLGDLPVFSGEARWSPGARIGYYSQEHQQLDLNDSPVESCQRVHTDVTAVRTMLGCLRLRADLALMPLWTMSMGERSKTALARLLLGGHNVLILDEPTNHLEMEAQDALSTALCQFPGAVLFASHDEWFSEQTATHTLDLPTARAHPEAGWVRAG